MFIAIGVLITAKTKRQPRYPSVREKTNIYMTFI